MVPYVVKTLYKLALIGGALAASLTCNLVAQTADTGNPAATGGKCGKGGKLMGELNLSKEQKKQIHPILQKAKESTKAIRADASIAREQKKQQIHAIREKTAEQLKAILTPEQFQKFQEFRSERKAEHKGKPSKGGNAPTPATT